MASTKLRSRQTAELVAPALGLDAGAIRQTDALRPSAEPSQVVAFLKALPAPRSVFIAGHLPCLARLAAFLLTGNDARPCVVFENAGLTCLEVDPWPDGPGALRWHWPPDQLALLARL